MKKRILSTILLLALIASAGTACGSEGSSIVTDSNTDTSSEATETVLIDTLVTADYKGRDFRILGESQSAGGDRFFVESETGDVIDDAVYRRNQAVSEKYNVNLKFDLVEWKSGGERIKELTLAGDNTYDLYTCTILYLGQLIVDNYFVDWKTIPSVHLDRPWYVKNANETYSIGDTTPLLFGDFMETNILRCWNFVFNKRLADECKLENPYTVVDEGRWTVDYLNTSIKDVARDLDGNSKWDENDFYGLATDSLATLDAFSRSLGLNAVSKDKDNLPVLSYWSDNVPSAFEAVYKLYYENPATYVDSQSVGHINKVFVPGNSIFASFRIDFLMSGEMREMKDDYGVLPYPKLSEGSGGYGTYLSGTFSAQMIGITQPESEHERIGIITEALNAYGHEYVTPSIYETTLKIKTSRDEKSIEMLDLILDSRQYSFDSCDENKFPLSPNMSIRRIIGSQSSSDITSHYASVKDSAQAWVDSMIEAYMDK